MSLVTSDLNQATPEKRIMVPAKADKHKVGADLKNGKIIFKQKPISFENLSETMQGIVRFRGFLETADTSLDAIPDEHLPLIANLVHESDKSINALAKSVQLSLLPPILEASQGSGPANVPTEVLPASVVEHAIKAVAERVNYGITLDSEKPPNGLCVWRWEVKNKDLLPKSVREKAMTRYNERLVAKKTLQVIFDELPEDEKSTMLKSSKPSKAPKGKEPGTETNAIECKASQPSNQNNKSESNGSESSTKKPGRPKKGTDPETVAKEQERQAQKALKAEKEKKDAEATKRSAAALASFFKSAPSTSKLNKPSTAVPSTQASPITPSSNVGHQSEFDATFKPFVVKKDAQLAPVNWFSSKNRHIHNWSKDKSIRGEIIELDNEGQEVQQDGHALMEVDLEKDDVAKLAPKDLLRSFLDSQSASLQPTPCRPSTSGTPYRVREIIKQLSEAEVQGDHRAVRKFTMLLKDRRKLPVKVLIFADNTRPGYLGTWTRRSSSIRPRTPFARDLLSFDYDHDSDAEWEEEEEGGDDVDSLDESPEDDMSSVGSDMDDWLVEGDEVEVELRKTPELPHPGPSSNKRKTSAGPRDLPNKKRKVIPLIPFQKGPMWESEIGRCEYEPFKAMRIQFFNDTPVPLDPFTFVTETVAPHKMNPSVTSKNVDGVFVVPAIPDRQLGTSTLPVPDPPTIDVRDVKRKVVTNPAPPPKTTFPDTHVPLLLQKIHASNTNSFIVLLDLVFQDIKALGVKKNALEVKLREVAEKDKVKKGWVVKEEAWTRHGLVKPT